VATPTAAGQIAVLLNPVAGRGRHAEQLPAVLEALRGAGREVCELAATSGDEAVVACRAAVTEGAGALVAVGGDGTLHAVVPAGTGNDFVVDLGLPADPLAAAGAVVAALRDGRTRSVDLARVSTVDGKERWFGAVLAAGFDAIVNERANHMRFPKGARRYDIAIVLELLRLRAREYTLILDGVEHRVPAVLVAVGNTASYGGGMRICPAADPNDGLLDIVVGARMGRGTLMRIKPKLYRGTHVEHPLVTTYRASTVELAGDGISTYVDGERAFPLPVTIRAVPGALTLLA
jgi:diacylglycerol kinase (ATP)